MNMQQTQSSPQILVVGLGKTGYSVASHLARQGVEFCVADSRKAPPMLDEFRQAFSEVDVHLGEFDPDFFSGFNEIIVSPGISLQTPALVEAGRLGAEIIGDVELFARLNKTPVIAITGSNGKSTVTQLAADMLNAGGIRALAGGNIGVPVLDLLEQHDYQVFVLELSSFQLETTRSLRPLAAVVLNVSADHMDRYESLEDYAGAKANIYAGAAHAVLNLDDRLAAELPPGANPGFGFSLKPDSGARFGLTSKHGETWLCRDGAPLLSATSMKLQGSHNLANVLAAFALIEGAGFELTAGMLDGAREFSGLSHRMEVVAEIDGVLWINDSKGTNVGATRAALDGLDRPVVLIAGGQSKGADLAPLAHSARGKVRQALLFGEDARLLETALAPACEVELCDSLEQAISRARQVAAAGMVVLFSPACASFDMFASFEHRGRCFRELVEAIG